MLQIKSKQVQKLLLSFYSFWVSNRQINAGSRLGGGPAEPSWRSFRSCPHVRGYFATLCVLAFVPLQTGFLVTRTDLYKCPLSVQNYRFLKITISGHLCGQNRPFVKRWRHHQSVPIPGLQILILLCRTPPCLIQTLQASDISNTWLRWNGSLVRLKKIHFWFHTRNQPWSAGWRSCVWPTTQPLLTRSSHPSWDFVALLDPPVALISYFLGCVYIGETLKPKVKSSFCVFTTERLYLTTREWEQDVRARCWFM